MGTRTASPTRFRVRFTQGGAVDMWVPLPLPVAVAEGAVGGLTPHRDLPHPGSGSGFGDGELHAALSEDQRVQLVGVDLPAIRGGALLRGGRSGRPALLRGAPARSLHSGQ